MKLEAAVIQGDGVGPEMMEEAVRVLQAVCRRFGHHLKLYPVLACSQAIEAGKEPLPQESLKICTQVPAVLFGNSGLKKYQDWPLDKYQYPSCAYVSFFKMFFSLKSRTSGAGNGCCFCP